MNSPRLSFLIFMFSLLSIKAFTINDTFPSFSTLVAFDLLGNSSSSFPGSSFLNYVLYGITEQRFYYYEFLQTYGFQVDKISHNNLVIGNDGLLGGICINTFNVIIPVPGEAIQMIPSSLIFQYFPNGYTILRNTDEFQPSSFLGNIYSRSNNSKMCNPCKIRLYYFPDTPLFSYSSLFYLKQNPSPGPSPFCVDFLGYFNEANLDMQKGTMHLFLIWSSIDLYLNIFEPNTQHLIQFTIDANYIFYFQGNVNMMFNGSMINYDFNGSLINYDPNGSLIERNPDNFIS